MDFITNNIYFTENQFEFGGISKRIHDAHPVLRMYADKNTNLHLCYQKMAQT